MDIKGIIGKFWKMAMLIVFGVSFMKDLVLVTVICGIIALGLSPLIAFVGAAGLSFILNLIGYSITT